LRFWLISKFKPLLDPYLGPYKDKYCYWTGSQLLIRALFFGFSALDSQVSLLTGMIITGVLHFAQGVIQPFKSQFHNFQESFVLLNLSLVYVITLHNYYNNVNNKATQYLILVVLVYYIFSIMYSCIATLCGNRAQQIKVTIVDHLIGCRIWKKSKSKSFEMSPKIMSNQIPGVTFNYKEFREPLVAVTDIQ